MEPRTSPPNFCSQNEETRVVVAAVRAKETEVRAIPKQKESLRNGLLTQKGKQAFYDPCLPRYFNIPGY